MINRTAADWQRLQDLPALLKELPALANELGFPYYSFSYTSLANSVSTATLPPDGQQLIQAALGFRPDNQRYSNVPVLWHEKAFRGASGLWPHAYALGLRHGWIQPLYDSTTHSSLTLLRPHVSLSIAERYEKTAWVMWLGERLHLAAARDLPPLTGDHEPCVFSREAQDPAAGNRSNVSCTPETKRD
ncbi:hypothetical protein [Pseudomonas sp. NPDC090592]|uniref:hypothetical protein n=1 Tax=Pseudomonas sp. NPDC090592 TaxID=3364480 RepID=UPI00383A5D2E